MNEVATQNIEPWSSRTLLEFLYRRGKRLYIGLPKMLGGWGGLSDFEICMQVASLPSEFWEQEGRETCEKIVEQHFAVFLESLFSLWCALALAMSVFEISVAARRRLRKNLEQYA